MMTNKSMTKLEKLPVPIQIGQMPNCQQPIGPIPSVRQWPLHRKVWCDILLYTDIDLSSEIRVTAIYKNIFLMIMFNIFSSALYFREKTVWVNDWCSYRNCVSTIFPVESSALDRIQCTAPVFKSFFPSLRYLLFQNNLYVFGRKLAVRLF